MASLTERCAHQTADRFCPVCLGLECLERPRYFTGQLLTESELNQDQAYLLAKHRLHNRYLHGPGVVCGLEVVCHDCEGWVTIKTGYAIDPCGNDIVVCQDHPFDLLKAIRECRQATRPAGPCDPFRPGADPNCRPIEEEFCITIAYEEKEVRPIATLVPERRKPCGCSSSCDSGCGCPCHQDSRNHGQCRSKEKTARNGSRPNQTLALGQCEPTRILESYRIGIVQLKEPCCPPFDRERYRNLLGWLWDLVPEDSLLMRIVDCFLCAFDFLAERLVGNDLNAIIAILTAQPFNAPVGNLTTEDLHRACCRFRQAIIDLLGSGRFNVRCQMLHALDEIHCNPPNPDHTPGAYALVLQAAVTDLLGVFLQYLLDCVCHAFIPVCSKDPEDKRLILACVTVRENKILRICNFGCRRYAGAFPTLYYWLSAFPVGPILKCLLERLCCAPDLVRMNSPLVNDLVKILERYDPTGALKTALLEGGGALPRSYFEQFTRLADSITPERFAEAIRPGDVNLTKLTGLSTSQAKEVLAGAKVSAVERELTGDAEIPPTKALRSPPFVSANETVVLYTKNEKVVGFARFDTSERLREAETEIARLKKEISGIRSEFRRATPTPSIEPKPSTRKPRKS